MKQEEIRLVVKETVRETLQTLGLSIDDPNEMQADMLHLRKMRKGCEAVRAKVIGTVITVTIPTLLYLVWDSLKVLVNK